MTTTNGQDLVVAGLHCPWEDVITIELSNNRRRGCPLEWLCYYLSLPFETLFAIMSTDVFFSPDFVSINNPNNPAEDYQPQKKSKYQAIKSGGCLGTCTWNRAHINCQTHWFNLFEDGNGLLYCFIRTASRAAVILIIRAAPRL